MNTDETTTSPSLVLKQTKEATSFTESNVLTLDGKRVPAGDYIVRTTVELEPINEAQ